MSSLLKTSTKSDLHLFIFIYGERGSVWSEFLPFDCKHKSQNNFIKQIVTNGENVHGKGLFVNWGEISNSNDGGNDDWYLYLCISSQFHWSTHPLIHATSYPGLRYCESCCNKQSSIFPAVHIHLILFHLITQHTYIITPHHASITFSCYYLFFFF